MVHVLKDMYYVTELVYLPSFRCELDHNIILHPTTKPQRVAIPADVRRIRIRSNVNLRDGRGDICDDCDLLTKEREAGELNR